MSKIYEALKKAEREHAAEKSTNGTFSEQAAPNGAAGASPMATTPEAQHITRAAPPSPAKERTPALLRSDGQPNKASGEFQVLSIIVQELAIEKNQHVVLISSSMPNEGKSFVALNLAASLARLGNNVTLIDADLRTPTLEAAFRITAKAGLMSYLLEKADFQACVSKTSIPGLQLVTTGGSTNSGPELFAGSGMKSFLAAMKRADPSGLILIDSPPILAASETRILAAMADALIVVVGANQTPRATVSRALTLVKDIPLLGLVLNRFQPPLSRRIEYGYGYAAKSESQTSQT
jgi:capsular exopolysaccharide synthesis family protein